MKTRFDNIAKDDESRTIPAFEKLNLKYGFEGRGFDPQNFQHLKQVHGNLIFDAKSIQTGISKGDGLEEARAAKTIAIMTADCLPILAMSKSKVFSVHAGWRGLSLGMISKLLERCELRDSHFAVGPAISGAKYEVGPEVIAAIEPLIAKKYWDDCMSSGNQDRSYLDIQNVAISWLLASDVAPSQISVVRSCTFSNQDLWYSYRREGAGVGRNWSWIQLI